MTTQDAIEHFGSQRKLAEALGLKQPTIAGWKKFPPPVRQLQLERLTKRKLRAEPNLLDIAA